MKFVFLLILILSSCSTTPTEPTPSEDSISITFHLPPTQEEFCNLQQFMLGQGYVLSSQELVLPNEFIQPIPHPLENCQ